MGRIKKAAGPKHEATVSPAIAEFVTVATTLPVSRLPKHLKSFPRRWPFPKGDLYHWIQLFNRFDAILDQFIVEYGLHDGPQIRPFGRAVLLQGVAEESKAATVTPTSESDLDSIGFGQDGDRQMVELILEFSRRLLESCGNRSLYSSSERLSHLLNTTSLSLLTTTLQLAVRLAQRYHASRQRGPNAYQNLNNVLLASHYNIDLEKVQRLANPFIKSPSSIQASITIPAPCLKGKEKAQNSHSGQSTSVSPNDLHALTTQDTKASLNGSAKHFSNADPKGDHASQWEDWGSVLLSYYQPATAPKEDSRQPPTPTPARRPSGLSRQSRLSSSDESPDPSMTVPNIKHDDSGAGGMRHVEIPYSIIVSSTVEEVLKDHLDNLPKDSRYELLTRVRSAYAMTTSLATRQELVGIRLLALTNLAYIYPDATFQQKILQQDSDEPRRLQLAYQLADLVHPPGDGASAIPYKLQTLALAALEALIKQKTKAPDVIAALNIHVSHGVLFYVLRRAVAEMAIEDSDDESTDLDKEERQEALFSLLETLPAATTRTIESLIASGLLDILVEVLNLRTRTAERSHPKVLTFLNSFIYASRDAMQSLANSRGLEAISDLLDYEVRSSMERAKNGEGLPEGFRTRVIDYQIPYFQQQSLKMVFKLIAHMMTNGTGNLDRLLRNLIDSPQLLSGLKTVIINPRIFGSSVWASAINIMSTFIHNEPTSYAVISEAGLNKGLLESIALESAPEDPMKVYLDFIGETDVFGPGLATSNASRIASFMQDDRSTTRRQASLADSIQGILPSSEAVLAVPQAFGAICLNHSGMQMFLESGALNSFFKLFESNDHIKSMAADRGDLPRILGNSFDELVRHHPTLKMSVMIAIMTMIERLGKYCQASATEKGCGAKLWLQGEDGSLVPAGEDDIAETCGARQSPIENDDDVVMGEASPIVEKSKATAMRSEAPLNTAESIEREERNSPNTATRIAVAMNFLSGFFENTSLCSFFIEAGGANYVLDLATMPSLQYDFNIQDASHHLARVVHIMVEQKPHLVLPSLVQRTQNTAENLGPLCSHTGEEGFFSEFTSSKRQLPEGYIPVSHASIGTTIVKSLVHVQTLCNILFEVFSSPVFTSRSGHTPFSQVNLADMYKNLIKSLGLLHRVCVWEEILLQKKLPEAWKEATRMKGIGMGSDEADEVLGFLNLDGELSGSSDSPTSNSNGRATGLSMNNDGSSSPGGGASTSTTKDENTAPFKNAKVLRYLLSQVPSIIVLFSQNLGKALTPKRRPEAYARQNAYLVAEAISEASLEQLTYEPPRKVTSSKDRYAYWIVALTSVSSLMIDRSPMQVLTLLLQAFKNAGGLNAIKEILNILFEEVKALAGKDLDKLDTDDKARLFSANAGIRIILPFYTQITMAKSIIESNQTNTIGSNERDRGSPHYFSAPQFLVELRMAILPVIRSIWNSEVVEKAEGPIIKGLIDILRTILEGGEEGGAFKRTDEITAAKNITPKIYTIQSDRIRELKDDGYNEEVAREALYRCMNERHLAREYCQALQTFSGASRCPIPSYDQEKPRESASQTPHRSDSGATLPASNHSHQAGGSNSNLNPLSGITDDMINTLLAARTASAGRTLDAVGGVEPSISTEPLSGAEGADAQGSSSTSRPPPPPAPGVPAETQGEAGEGMAMSIDNLQNSNFNLLPVTTQGQDPMRWTTLAGQLPGGPSPSDPPPNQSEIPQPAHHVTVDDLDEERSAIRQNLIDRALDVVNAHEHVTFELADLINAATTKSPDAKTMRREIGETLVQSLISLQMEDDFRPAGKKIASYANLLALVIQDQKFYEATLDELVGNLEQFLCFIKIFADQPPDEASPWIGQILLVIEKMLAEDVQPSLIQWTISTDGKISEGPIVDIEPSFVPTDAKVKLFEAIVEILPRVGKDESLALSVVRALVILTRNRDLASRLSEKRNIQRLFVMVKQLAGLTTDRLLSTFMLLLRHLVEDEHTIRQIMRSEIMTRFETRRGGQTDTASYVKQMYDLVLRSPQIFVDVTNEKLEIARYEPSQRVNQNLQLKPEVKDESKEPKPTEGKLATSTTEASTGAVEGQLAEAPKPSFIEQDEPTAQKAKANETKAPVVEHPSGVIHFLLLELLNYKDVEDKDPTASAKELLKGLRTTSPADTQDPGDATNGASASNSTTASPANPDASETKKSEKLELKPEQHPMHFYRLFLLQCLAELLHCYNSTKVEFINFSRKADAKAMTPSKPRSGVLNYLLNDVIPVGTLSHEETLAYKKRNLTSNWAMSVIVSLCLRTSEKGYYKKQGSIEEDEESDLLFVRKFVLEHGLKAYKDAHASEEEADVKYARLLDLADLFNRLLQGRIVPPVGTPPPGMEGTFQKSIAKLMFEKNFISALTSSIADIDLNFPASKRAIKYILRPLKQLTSTAVVLSQDSDISTTPGQTDDDEISTATSVSDVDDEREETPDLFRNSTLGMFEPGREEESSSDSSGEDEEMYDEEYDDGMDYDEGLDRDENEVISDEDEELGEAGHMEGLPGDAGMDVEVVIDGDDEDPSDDEDDEDQDDSEDDMDNMDDGDEIEVIDEINGDSENGSLAGGEDDGWQDEDGDDIERYNEEDGFENDLSQDQDAESAVRDIVREFGGAEAALQRLEGLEDGPSDLQMDIDSGRYMEDVVHLDDDDDEEDEEDGGEDDVDDDDVIYQPEYDDEDPGMPEPPFGWDPDDEMSLPRHHHHHHHHHPRRVPDTFYSASLGGGGLDRTPLYRSHRPAGGPRSNDDNVNPLLQRHDRSTSSRSLRGLRSGPSDVAASLNDYWIHGMESARRRGIMPGESPLSFLNSLIASVDQNGGFGLSAMGGPNGALHLHIAGGPGGGLSLPRELQIALGGTRHTHQDPQHIGRDEHRQPTAFQPAVTYQRWQEEARLLYGNLYSLKAERIVNTILRLLVPPALEKKKREEDDLKRMKEQLRQEEQEAREKAEKEAQEKREQEEREAAAARAMEEAEAAARAQEESREESHAAEVAEDGGAMEGVESAQIEETTAPTEGGAAGELQASGDASAAAGPSEPAERVRTTIRGRELDITGLGIDLAYLDALPEDIREEVLMSQLAIQRSQAQAAGEEPTDISREFLEALPVEIREELLQQEAQDRRRRERDEARRRQQAAGGAPARGAEDMDPASFLASLDPTLRQHVLMDQDEEILAHLPEEIAAEARALGGDRAMHRFAGIPRGGHGSGLVRHLLDGSRQPPATLEKPPRRQTVQMLDKAGVATLLRLMFIPQQGSSRTSLNGILHDVSKNRQNRAEVISLLLSILQDGSADVNAVERSFAHLSLRAKQPATQKTPQTLKRTFTGQMASVANNMEATPLMVIQQCLSALVSLTHYNLSIPWFFLTEHEVSSGIKTKANRKGKGKETRASKYALNALLSLLDRKLIMESSGCMEQLSSLLQSVTHPLLNLLRKEKENVEEKHKELEPIEIATTSPEAINIPSSGTDGQPAEGAVESGEPSTGVSMSPMVDVEADTATEQQEPPAPTTETEAKKEEEKKAADTKASVEEQKKRVRIFTPPVVPEENLRLVVNVLAARECSAKTFRDTLSTINNLSGIPGAKEVFGKGLIEQAQDLGQSILQDLDDLVPQIKQAESGTDIQGMALAKFSPASSDQAKLLRVLTALDYLFDPKRNGGKTKPAAEEGQSGESSTPKEDILTTLYENATFGSLWNKLSECLSSIHQAEGMLNIATILLPLVEALMVVCKNTTLKDIPLIKTAKEFAITSPPPESYMENLFFKFTEDHRKILNELVRQNPKLMSANFALLVKNPKVLEFDNKRNYFTRRLHSRGTEARHTQPPLQLAVRRDTVFLDSFKFLHFKSGDEIKYGKLSIRFNGEEGVDAGGVTREWFQVLSRQMFNPDYALFIPVASDRTTFHPNKLSKVNDEHLMFFKFIGRIIGKALYEGRALDCHFSRAVYKRILGKTVSIKDMETLDLEYYKSLLWMLENDITDIITETFSVETDDFGVTEIVDLKESGRNIPVTEDNKHEYVQLVVEYRLTGSVQEQLSQFLKGFHDIVPPELIAIFNEQELELLISGLPDIDVDDWKNHTEYHNYQVSSPQIQWFWRAVRSFDKEERAKLLQFVTGTSKVPLNGFGQLEGMNGFSKFNIHRDYGNKDRLPSSHTCFNQLDLPEYDSYETLRQQVYTAMTAGSEYFGFA